MPARTGIVQHGDCVELLAILAENYVDAVVTDPPYHLTSIVRRFGSDTAAPAQVGKTGAYRRHSTGFMGRKWDAPDPPAIDPAFAFWMAGFIDGEGCFSVHKKSVNGCETYDCQFSMTLRADDRDIIVEIQRQLGGIGSIADRPAPKEGDGKPQVRYCISSQRDCWRLREVLLVFPLRAKKARDFEIWAAALDAWIAHEPGSSWEEVAYFRDALMAVRKYGADYHPSQLWSYRWAREVFRVLKPGGHMVAFGGTRTYHRMACAIEDAGFEIRDTLCWMFGSGFPKSHNIGDGWGTALKPAFEPIVLARKPLSEGTVAANVLRWGTGAINVDGCRVAGESTLRNNHGGTGNPEQWRTGNGGDFRSGSTTGRWPANVVHDGSDEVVGMFPDNRGQAGPEIRNRKTPKTNAIYGKFRERLRDAMPHDIPGSAARFFYAAKASKADRAGSKHPTIKPISLLRWLCRMVTPPSGIILDPFAGSGTTAAAALAEGFRYILMEREPEYIADIERRLSAPRRSHNSPHPVDRLTRTPSRQ